MIDVKYSPVEIFNNKQRIIVHKKKTIYKGKRFIDTTRNPVNNVPYKRTYIGRKNR